MIGPLVLIVEDDPSQLEILRHNVSGAGYQVVTASDGAGAIDAYEAHQPDLVLLDWMLPKLSGIEVCRNIRNRHAGSGTPIIIVSARTEEDDLIKGLNTGADDYIYKPYSIAELLVRIKANLRRANPASVKENLRFQDIEMNTDQHRVYRGRSGNQAGANRIQASGHFP